MRRSASGRVSRHFQDSFRLTDGIFIGPPGTQEHAAHVMNGLTPQQSTCPHCGIQRTVRMGFSGVSICMNCRSRWGASSNTNLPADPREESEPAYPFTPAELERLAVYRRAVAAGFYSGYLSSLGWMGRPFAPPRSGLRSSTDSQPVYSVFSGSRFTMCGDMSPSTT